MRGQHLALSAIEVF